MKSERSEKDREEEEEDGSMSTAASSGGYRSTAPEGDEPLPKPPGELELEEEEVANFWKGEGVTGVC